MSGTTSHPALMSVELHCRPDRNPGEAAYATYAVVYQTARDLGYSELEAMVYATEPDLLAGDHPDMPIKTSLDSSGAPP